MKTVFYITIVTIVSLFSSCEKRKPYSINWEGNNLCVVLHHSSQNQNNPIGYWRGVVDDIYNEISTTDKLGNISLFLSVEDPKMDKYGNESMEYYTIEINSIPISEAKKYKSGTYFDMEYGLINNFLKATSLRQQTLPDGTKVYLAPGDSLPTTQQVFTSPIEQPDSTAIFDDL